MKIIQSTFSALLGTAVVLAGISLTSQRADASLIAYICDDAACTGGGDTIVTDQGVGDNFPGSALVGEINSGALNVAGFTIVTNVTQSKPDIGSSALPMLNLTVSAVTSDNNSHTIYLYASDTGFTGSGAYSASFGGTQPPTGAGGSETANFYGGNSNTNLDLSNSLATFSSSVTPFNLSSTGSFSPGVNPYSLTVGIVITRAAAGTSGGSAEIDIAAAAVPEPASITLLGMGLLGLFGVSSRLKARR